MKWHEVSPIPVKRRVRFKRNGHTFIDELTKADLSRVRDSWDGGIYLKEPLALIIEVYQALPESKQRLAREPFTLKPDIDNIIKAVMDGLNSTAYHDDKQIVFVACHKCDRSVNIQGEYVRYMLCPYEEMRSNGIREC